MRILQQIVELVKIGADLEWTLEYLAQQIHHQDQMGTPREIFKDQTEVKPMHFLQQVPFRELQIYKIRETTITTIMEKIIIEGSLEQQLKT